MSNITLQRTRGGRAPLRVRVERNRFAEGERRREDGGVLRRSGLLRASLPERARGLYSGASRRLVVAESGQITLRVDRLGVAPRAYRELILALPLVAGMRNGVLNPHSVRSHLTGLRCSAQLV